MGVTLDGYKDILSITVGANETSKLWLGMLNDLKNRGVQDVLYFCVDGLSGFKEAIQVVYNAPNETAALSELEGVKEKWGKKYPYAISNWENNWQDVSSFFQFSGGGISIMGPEISWVGSSTKSADCSIWRTTEQLSLNKNGREQHK